MTIIGEPALFGAKPDHLDVITLVISRRDEGYWTVQLRAHVHNKMHPMVLTVTAQDNAQLHGATGLLQAFLQRLGTMSPSLARRSMWALHNTFGERGYEVSVAGCGANR